MGSQGVRGAELHFGQTEEVWRWMGLMATQQCECTH